MKQLLKFALIFIIWGCKKNDTQNNDSITYYNNSTFHYICIKKYLSNTIVDSIIILPKSNNKLSEVTLRGKSKGYCYCYNFDDFDSLNVIFDYIYSTNHLPNRQNIIGTGYKYNNPRNLYNINNYVYKITDERKNYQKNEYLYEFKEQDYLDAKK